MKRKKNKPRGRAFPKGFSGNPGGVPGAQVFSKVSANPPAISESSEVENNCFNGPVIPASLDEPNNDNIRTTDSECSEPGSSSAELPLSGEPSDEILTVLLRIHGPQELQQMLVQKYGADDLRVLLPQLLPEYPRTKFSDEQNLFSGTSLLNFELPTFE